jgi:hypothetical protein
MSSKNVKPALESNYPRLIHDLVALKCSDDMIKAIVVGAFGTEVRNRVAPIIAMVRAYENLSQTEKIDMLLSFVERQDFELQNESMHKKLTA